MSCWNHACCVVFLLLPAAANYYDLLGVDVDASEEDVRAAYRRKAKQLHPDVNKEVKLDRQEAAAQSHALQDMVSAGHCC
jgi:hypothetical protein